MQTALLEAPVWGQERWESARAPSLRLREHIESVYLTLILDLSDFSQSLNTMVKDRATVDAHMDMLHSASAMQSVKIAGLML